MKPIILLGSTGSIGTQTLELLRAAQGEFTVVGLAARNSWESLLAQAEEFRPECVALASPEAADRLRDRLPTGIRLLEGPGAAEEMAAECSYDLAVHGMVGAAGLRPSMAVIERGCTLALANKESMVIAGAILMEAAERSGAEIVPVDSEHAAIFQCLRSEQMSDVRRVFLTASGGPFRDMSAEEIGRATPEQAVRHPNWDMGPRISVGSATLMNKAFEVIEAHHLFGLAADQIEILVHRQSIVHSMVEFVDGTLLAQAGPPDMKQPLHCALHHPTRVPSPMPGFDLELFRNLTFEAPDPERFPALSLGHRCVASGGILGCVLNAADEVAVEAFLGGRLEFNGIIAVVQAMLDREWPVAGNLGAIIEADVLVRREAAAWIEQRGLATGVASRENQAGAWN